MKELFLIKLGEMVLKGQNRKTFDDMLLRNIRRQLKYIGNYQVKYAQSTVYVTPEDEDCDMDQAEERIRKVFGIIKYSRAARTEKTLEDIQATAVDYLQEALRQAKTFKVESKRADKTFPLNSMELSRELGGYILSRFPHLKVDVHHPELTVYAEVRDFGAYVHGNPKDGPGGIPVGTGGKAVIMISGGIDSPVASYMMARRGVELTAVHFASPPYTSERAEQKVKELLERVSEYSGGMVMQTVGFTHVQEEILKNCPEELFTIIMRRFMVRVAQAVAEREDCKALITGESLGQVASQTMQAIACTDAVATMPVFRPLIGTDKAEIVALARKIETFDISIEPYEDCCTVFTPRHPRTKPPLFVVEQAEQALDVEGLFRECLENIKYTGIRRQR